MRGARVSEGAVVAYCLLTNLAQERLMRKVKELKGKLYSNVALEALSSFLLPYQRAIINFILCDRSSCKIVLSPILPFFLMYFFKVCFPCTYMPALLLELMEIFFHEITIKNSVEMLL